jgi:hypothetical protein
MSDFRPRLYFGQFVGGERVLGRRGRRRRWLHWARGAGELSKHKTIRVGLEAKKRTFDCAFVWGGC